MNSRTTRTGLISSIGLGWYAAIVFASTPMAQAQQRYYPQQQGGYQQPPQGYQQQPPGYGYPQQQPQTQYENPLQFLPKFGQRMSEMARRLFYGKNPTGYDSPPPAYGQNGGGYSLDSTPRQQAAPNYPQQSPEGYPLPGSGYVPQQPGYQYPQQQQQQQPQSQSQPRYNYPPQQTTAPQPQQTSPVPSSKSKTPTPPPQSKSSPPSSTHKYTPPKVNDSPPARTTSRPATVTPKKEPKPDAPPPTTPAPTTRRSESTPKEFPSTTSSSGSSGSFLKGKRTAKPGRVISPYPPYKELDITGLESGSLALDPTTQKVFEVP
jgi:hypothetical protein